MDWNLRAGIPKGLESHGKGDLHPESSRPAYHSWPGIGYMEPINQHADDAQGDLIDFLLPSLAIL
jgi:hypothetical protein